MKIGIACGGTGGHIFPGLATAEVLRKRGHEVTLWLSGRDIEKEALGSWDGAVITIPTRGFPSRPGIKYAGALWLLGRAFLQCRRKMRLNPPNVLLAMGGYASAAPVMAARLLSIPVVLHEANVIPGRANRLLSRWAKVFALGFDETRSHIAHRNMVYTGMPLRKMNAENTKLERRGRDAAALPLPESENPAGRARASLAELGQAGPAASLASTGQALKFINADWNVLKPGVFTILAMGGSRGAHALNEIVAQAVAHLQAGRQAAQIIHLTGAADEISVRKIYQDNGVPHLVFSFLHNTDQAYRQASLAICRAGASTCAELASYGVPAILIPYPYAAADHQLANARVLKNAGAADVMEEKDLTPAWLAKYIRAFMADPERLQRMKQAALKRADKAPDAAATLADLVLEIGKDRA